ncbi:hypothetical protein NC797_06795 [Aquibacillus sp. 3ASR75-11]|uniref:Uncharacterized protein n=1 Tax=Terrihalobacillus insolitus TaxID=2950438 RepID=A0A9X3WVJ8_9BACI|nr:hypothetical protein [Terrihalobacillus insolitus]MDC3424214.1 hypothetical protein [Terrihalobacillus insolitus]
MTKEQRQMIEWLDATKEASPLFSIGADARTGGFTWSGGHDSISVREPISLHIGGLARESCPPRLHVKPTMILSFFFTPHTN